MTNLKLDENNPLQLFLYALRAPESRRQYPRRLKIFLDYLTENEQLVSISLEDQAKEFINKTRNNPKWANTQLMEFVLFQKERARSGEIVFTTIRNYLKATKLFLDMNSEVPLINWKRIIRALPSAKNAASDRPPSIEELRRLIEYPDRRLKPIITCMVSGGFRLGSWDYLRWKHVTPITDEDGKVIAAKMIIYGGEPEEYFCFISPEAFEALNEWMLFRMQAGEDITKDAWLIRDIWSATDFDSFKNNSIGFVRYPKKLKSSGIKSLIERAMRAQGLAKPLPRGVKRREWKSGHGYRKFFKTKAEQLMKPANVELLSGRDIGISQSYYKPTEQELLIDYLKAVALLTISHKHRLILENQEIAKRNQMLEKDKEEVTTLRRELEPLIALKNALIQEGVLRESRYCAS